MGLTRVPILKGFGMADKLKMQTRPNVDWQGWFDDFLSFPKGASLDEEIAIRDAVKEALKSKGHNIL